MEGEQKFFENKSLSPEEQENASKIEKLPISDEGKIDLILVWRKLKPASDIQFLLRSWYKEEKQEISPEEEKVLLDGVRKLFNSLNLSFFEGPRKHNEIYSAEEGEKEKLVGDVETQLFFVASSSDDTKKLAEAWEKNERESSGDLGRLFGFPGTAITAYEEMVKRGWDEGGQRLDVPLEEITGDIFIEQEALPEQVRRQDFVAFAEYRLSKDNWQEELETARRWADEIRVIDPDLYNRKVQEYHSRTSF